MTMMRMALALGALVVAAGAWAQSPGVVEAVQFPAWLDRGGRSVPLSPGTELLAKDSVRTGPGARALLRLSEGSLVKLGENAQFTIEKAQPEGVFRASLNVLAGAFRFTTDALRKTAKRDVRVVVKNVTVGIRGTDLWGKSTAEKDFVILLEGSIEVGSPGQPTVTLAKPLEVYTKPASEAPTLGMMDPELAKVFAQETELSAEGPVGRKGGGWRVIAAVPGTRDAALALNRTLRALGYPSEVASDGKSGRHVVQVTGLAGEAEARSVMANLRGVQGVAAPLVREGPLEP